MDKNEYYRNDCFGLAWDCIKVRQTNLFITTVNAINSKPYFYKAVCELNFPLNSKFTDVTRRVSEVTMTSFYS